MNWWHGYHADTEPIPQTQAPKQSKSHHNRNREYITMTAPHIPTIHNTRTPQAEPTTPQAQYELGRAYHTGQGKPKDHKKAVYWYTKAGEQGHAKAQYRLGKMYRTGDGITKNTKQAVYWLTKAGEQGVHMAQFFLGMMYDYGQGVPQDQLTVFYWFKKAVENGNETAKEYLRRRRNRKQQKCKEHITPNEYKKGQARTLYFIGTFYRGTNTQDIKKAVDSFTQSAKLGDADAQYELGEMYHTGDDVPQDYKQAMYWFKKANTHEQPCG